MNLNFSLCQMDGKNQPLQERIIPKGCWKKAVLQRYSPSIEKRTWKSAGHSSRKPWVNMYEYLLIVMLCFIFWDIQVFFKLIKTVQIAFLILCLCIFLLCLHLELVVSFFIGIKISEGLCSQTWSSLQMLSAKLSAAASVLSSRHWQLSCTWMQGDEGGGVLGPVTHVFSGFCACLCVWISLSWKSVKEFWKMDLHSVCSVLFVNFLLPKMNSEVLI